MSEPVSNYSNQNVPVIEGICDTDVALLAARYGLDGQEPLSVEEVARRGFMTREEVRSLEAEALRRLELAEHLAQRIRARRAQIVAAA